MLFMKVLSQGARRTFHMRGLGVGGQGRGSGGRSGAAPGSPPLPPPVSQLDTLEEFWRSTLRVKGQINFGLVVLLINPPPELTKRSPSPLSSHSGERLDAVAARSGGSVSWQSCSGKLEGGAECVSQARRRRGSVGSTLPPPVLPCN